MSILYVVFLLIVIGFLLWLVEKYIPMNETFKKVVYAVAAIAVVLWLLQTFGILGNLEAIRVK
jgi:hypothetical protein